MRLKLFGRVNFVQQIFVHRRPSARGRDDEGNFKLM